MIVLELQRMSPYGNQYEEGGEGKSLIFLGPGTRISKFITHIPNAPEMVSVSDSHGNVTTYKASYEEIYDRVNSLLLNNGQGIG